jgi:multidrug efflux pump
VTNSSTDTAADAGADHGPAMGPHRGFNLSSWTLNHQPLVIFLLVLLTIFGIGSYGRLAQSEDPPFTFKVMVIRTVWPGATARQVQEEVTDRIARKLQENPDVDFQRSYSRPGESCCSLPSRMPCRRHRYRTPGTRYARKWATSPTRCRREIQGPYFNDEFGDVYTNIYALVGDGFSAGAAS